jgi:exodeoxyribonuclease V alpha subunit
MPLDLLLRHIEQAVDLGCLRPLDAAFARFLAEQEGTGNAAAPMLGALVSQQSGEGHLCLELGSLDDLTDQLELPESWRQVLLNTPALTEQLHLSTVIAREDQISASPLVLDQGRLYLRRYWDHERLVASAIQQRLLTPVTPPPGLKQELLRLFPDDASRTVQWPRVACALAARSAFTIITGGPGTGKTTAVVRLLGLLQTLQLAQHSRPLRIRLAAPTGKAAARLNASIASQVAALDVDEAVRAAIPTDVVTLHRLLGARPETRRFHHQTNNRLHLDVLVIDEASMIDLELMSAVLAALPPETRLILIGDKDQLSSVEAGAVLGDLCSRAQAGHYSNGTIQWLQQISGDDITPWASADAVALDQHVAMLRQSHRFDAGSGIGHLATLVNQGNVDAAIALLARPSRDLQWHASSGIEVIRQIVLNEHTGYRHYLSELAARRPDRQAPSDTYDDWARHVLNAFARFQLLCAVRGGPEGTIAMNARVAGLLHAQGAIEAEHGWYEGKPVMVTRNDYSLGLMNGDVGIALRVPGDDGNVALRVAFQTMSTEPSGAGRMRFIPPSRLTALEPVYAMTVHKSQGSEFDHAVLVLPQDMDTWLTRELIYTGITRARTRFGCCASLDALRVGIAQTTSRRSALKERLSQ